MNAYLTNDRTARATIEGVTLGVTRSGNDWEGRTRYLWQVQNRTEWVEGGDDLSTGVGMDHGPVAMLATLATFLSAAGESFNYAGSEGENAGMFPANVTEWAAEHTDELDMLAYEIEGE